MSDTIYTCLECGNQMIRKQGFFYTADVPVCCGKIMQANVVKQATPEEKQRVYNLLLKKDE